MLSLPLPVKIYLCVAPADMRRGFDGLANLVREWQSLAWPSHEMPAGITSAGLPLILDSTCTRSISNAPSL